MAAPDDLDTACDEGVAPVCGLRLFRQGFGCNHLIQTAILVVPP